MIVTLVKGKYYDLLGIGGKLTYDTKREVYTCYKNKKKMWEKRDKSGFFDYYESWNNEWGNAGYPLERDRCMAFPIYREYSETIQK